MQRAAVVGGVGMGIMLLIAGGALIWFLLNPHDVEAPTHAMAIRAVEACPAAAAELGTPITRADTPGGEKGATRSSWTFTVKGPRGRGLLSYEASRAGGAWVLRNARLSVGGRGLDLLACSK